MLQRTRSASLPRDLGEGYFLGESDFHSDIYDNINNEEPQQIERNEKEQEKEIEKEIEIEKENNLLSFKIIFKVIIMIFTGAISSILYEMMLTYDKNASLLAAFILHLWIVLFSLPNLYQHIFYPKIPIYYHLLIVMLSFTFLFLKSFAIKILPMPIIIVCSNMQLVLGLFVGKFLFNKIFCFNQYLAVFIITFGCTLITITSQDSFTSSLTFYEVIKGLFYILTAILSLTIMIPIGSLIVQKYNANIEEQIFYQHFLSFPLFLLQWNRIQPSINQLIPFYTTPTTTTTLEILSTNLQENSYIKIYHISIPIILILLISTTIFAQLNRYLTMEISLSLSPLLSQLLNTINKTIVLLVSMIYFNSPPYPSMIVWIGVIVQTIGSFIYVQSSIAPPSPSSPTLTNTNTDTTTITEKGRITFSRSSFQISQRKSRFSRVSITGKRLGISEVDLRRLKNIAEKSNSDNQSQQQSNIETQDNQENINTNFNQNQNQNQIEIQNDKQSEYILKDNNNFIDTGIKRRVAYSSLPDYKR